MKVAVIGNSHLAAVKAGWPQTDYSITFLGGTQGYGGFFDQLHSDDEGRSWRLADDAMPIHHQLWLQTKGDREPYVVDDYDHVFVIGVGVPANPWRLSCCLQTPGIERLREYGVAPISYAVWKRAAHAYYQVKRLTQVTQRFSSRSALARLWHVPLPMHREDIHAFFPDEKPPASWLLLDEKLQALTLQNEWSLLGRLYSDHGLRLLPTPPHLIRDGFRCPACYSQDALGSRNFKPNQPSQWGARPLSDINHLRHKNAQYGAEIAKQIVETIDRQQTKPASLPVFLTDGESDALH